MTIINGIEIDAIDYKMNDIKYAIKNNDPLEKTLHLIVVISNPCIFARRYKLFNQFVKRIEEEEDHVQLYVVEMAYGKQRFVVTQKDNKHHLQLRCTTPIWHKENMVNLAVEKLLPNTYKAFAWVDADVEFESNTWALDTLKILNGCKDVVQLFSHCLDLSAEETNLNIFNGFGFSFSKNKKYTTSGLNYWHPGYAWAMTRKAYEKLGGLYDKGILGSGDNIMALSFIHQSEKMNHREYHEHYNQSMLEYQQNAKQLRLGYVPGMIRHHYHGSKENRKYTQRWQLLMQHKYSPNEHLQYDEHGVLVPTEKMPVEFSKDIMKYFMERKEDD